MTKDYCDICGHDLVEHSLEDLLGSRKFIIREANRHSLQKELVLCGTCKEAMYYLITNSEALMEGCRSMSLPNRIRFLFKRPLKVKRHD